MALEGVGACRKNMSIRLYPRQTKGSPQDSLGDKIYLMHDWQN